jgi:hypothetical protein
MLHPAAQCNPDFALAFVDYYNDMNDSQRALFIEQSFILHEVSLEIEHFGEFYEKRKIIDKYENFLSGNKASVNTWREIMLGVIIDVIIVELRGKS